MKSKKKILLNPGPATTSYALKQSLVVDDICPRESEFIDVIIKLNSGLLEIVNADSAIYSCIPFAGSGTLVMDVCINSLVPDGKKILILNNGTYSSRAIEICKFYQLNFVEIKSDDRKSFDFDLIKSHELNDVSVIYMTHHETGTGVLNDIRKLSDVAHRNKWLSVVDTISTYAILPIDINELDIDFIMTSSQKGIGAFAGLAFIIGKNHLIESSKHHPKRSYYNNLFRQYEYFKVTNQMHFTPPVQIAYASLRAVENIFAEGLTNKYDRHFSLMQEIRKNFYSIGFKEYIEKQYQSNVLLSVSYPEDLNWSFEKIHDYCYERGITIYPGKNEEQKYFRLSVFGDVNIKDIKKFFKIFRKALEFYEIKIPIN
jgi:2-aminoethylphosphonate-pyruvate transaminase